MSVRSGRHYTAIPGPSVMPDRVLQAMHRAAPNIYSPELADLVGTIVPDLKAIAGTKHHAAMYIANGHGVWEAVVSNTLNRGDKVLVPATGRFAFGWAAMAERMGVECDILDFGKRSPIDLDAVATALAADKAHQIKAVLAVHVDTSTSVKNDIEGLRAVLDAAKHPALLMADCMASLGCDRFEMDALGVDVMLAGCQKGLMTPPGMGFIFFNDKADAVRGTCTQTSHYWDWRPGMAPEEFSQYFDGTAPTHQLFALREALNMINEEGLENVWARHETLARAYWAAIDAWGQGGPMELNIANPALRGHSVTAVRIGASHGTALRDWLEAEMGVTLGVGLGMAEPNDPAWHGFFRIGHMGHVNGHMVMGALGAIQSGLIALGIPHGPGALDAAAQICANP